MTVFKVQHEGHSLTVEQEWIDVTAMSEPDPAWTYTDRGGHVHRAVKAGSDRVDYPTLDLQSSDPHWCWECQDTHVDHWWECPLCEEKIVPGSRMGQPRKIPGMTTFMIDDEPVSPQAARDFVASWQREMNERYGGDQSHPSVRAAVRMADEIRKAGGQS